VVGQRRGQDRQAALDRLGRALDEIRIEGIRTTVPLFKALLADDDFRSGEMDITMLDRKLESGELAPAEGGGAIGTAEGSDLAADLPLLAAALAHHERAGRRAARPGRAADGSARSGWAGRARSEAVGRGPWS
jgi:acetyl/propionyl-CoA carboxylase alpha subunit